MHSEVFQIKQNDKPHIGKTIKSLRDYRGLSQDDIAQAAFFNRSTLSQIEVGNQECPDRLLLDIKTALDVENLPLSDVERVEFKDSLYKWHDIINERKQDEANELRVKLSVIKLLPHDKELNMLFSLFECKLLLLMNELAASKEILDALDIDGISDFQLYHYYYNQGTYNIKSKFNQEALDFYLKAYELMKCGLEKNTSLYVNIAFAYRRVGLVAHGISFLEEACKIQSTGKGNVPELHLYNWLGIDYIGNGNLQRAKYMLDKAHAIALCNYQSNESTETKTDLGMVLLNYGYMFRMARKWRLAIEYFDKALIYLSVEDDHYLETLYQKTRSLIEMGNTLSCPGLIADGIKLSQNNEVYTLMFEALKILMSPNEESAKHLEANALPYLLENNFVHLALDYSMFLRDYYKTRRSFKTRALEMAEIVCTLYSLMHKGGVIE